nr:palindromic element RPE4 domain-containing protein [Rickettsia bellii]
MVAKKASLGYTLSSRGLTTGSSNKKYKYKKLRLSCFILDPVVKPRDDICITLPQTLAVIDSSQINTDKSTWIINADLKI